MQGIPYTIYIYIYIYIERKREIERENIKMEREIKLISYDRDLVINLLIKYLESKIFKL